MGLVRGETRSLNSGSIIDMKAYVEASRKARLRGYNPQVRFGFGLSTFQSNTAVAKATASRPSENPEPEPCPY